MKFQAISMAAALLVLLHGQAAGPGLSNIAQPDGNPKGRTLLRKMADAIIAPGTRINTLTLIGEVTLNIGGQNQQLPLTMHVHYPDEIEQTVKTSDGSFTMALKNGKGTMKMGAQEQSLPDDSPEVKSLRQSLNQSVIAIAMKAEALDPQFIGTEKIDNFTYDKVEISINDTRMELFLNRDTNLPGIIRYKQYSEEKNGEIIIENHYSNWTSKGGVTYPYKQISMNDDEQIAKVMYSSHIVNEKN